MIFDLIKRIVLEKLMRRKKKKLLWKREKECFFVARTVNLLSFVVVQLTSDGYK